MLGFPFLFEILERDVNGQIHCRDIEFRRIDTGSYKV